MKQYTFLTLFPELFPGPVGMGVVGRGIERGVLQMNTVSIREHGIGRHRVVDDTPYGGGSGMVMKPDPVVAAIQEARKQAPEGTPVYFMSPQGPTFTQAKARELVQHPGLILLCGRYEGIDDRVMEHVDGELSVGDYVLSGGELAAMIVVDAVARLIPGVLGNPESLHEESFGSDPNTESMALLEYPQYTRPREFEGKNVPDVLLSGNHELIRKWRLEQSLRRTLERRPDLLHNNPLTPEAHAILATLQAEEEN